MTTYSIFDDRPPETEVELDKLCGWRKQRARWLAHNLTEAEVVSAGDFLDLIPFITNPSPTFLAAVRLAQDAAAESLRTLLVTDLPVETASLPPLASPLEF